MTAILFSSGLFLGWSLGANDASNVFGTAVGTGMIRFRTAAICCSLLVILGAVISGAGASQTLGKLGAVNALPGAFMVAMSAAFCVYAMTKLGHPVSTSQAIVGGIIGWNFFSGSLVDYNALAKIAGTWVACPILAAIFAVSIFFLVKLALKSFQPHILVQDSATRYGLFLAGAFGSYALGANNIANVMGVFVPVADFPDISFFGLFTLNSTQQLFLVGGLAIAVGVTTYSKHVMLTVGGGILRLSPVGAFIVVVAHSMVLFIFSSQDLNNVLTGAGLPPIPLVPVSSSQAIVGAVIGIGLLKGGRGIRWKTVGQITVSWVVTPVVAAIVCYISLFFLQNVFQQKTFQEVRYQVTLQAVRCAKSKGVDPAAVSPLVGRTYLNAMALQKAVESNQPISRKKLEVIMDCTRMKQPPSGEAY